MRPAIILPLLAAAALGNQCSKGDTKCESEGKTNHYALMGMLSEMFDTAVRYSTDLKEYEELDALMNSIINMQSQQEDFLPRRTSYEEAVANVEAWAKKRYFLDGISAKVVPEMGGAVFATKDMKAEHKIGNISVHDVLSTQQTEDDYKCLGNIMYTDAKYTGLWRLTNLTLLFLRHAYDENSEYRAYIDSLPMSITHPTFFTYDEMAALKGSVVFEGSANAVQEMAAMYTSIYQRLKSNPECAKRIGVPLEKFTLKAFRYAYTMALSRNYDGSFIDGQRNKVMIPFWDLFNHNPDPDLDTYNELPVEEEELSEEEKTRPSGNYVTYATKDIKSGQQVFMHYLDPLDPIEAFSTWGFVEVNEITLDFITTNLTALQKKLVSKLSWFKDEEFTFQNPDKGGNVVKPKIVTDLIDIISIKRRAELTPSASRAAWELILAQVNHQLNLFAHPVEKYREMLKNEDLSPNLRLIYQEMVAEIEFLAKIKNYVVNEVLS